MEDIVASAIEPVKSALKPSTRTFKPVHGVCEWLNALHVYADEAKAGKTRFVEANHFCSQIRKDLRQCLIYDSNSEDARLIGVEYMIPKERYLQLPPEEQKLWHSHEFEVKSGMLILPTPPGMVESVWEMAETEAMKEVMGLYGKTWHFWQVDKGDELPLGYPKLMGSFTNNDQIDLNQALSGRDNRYGVDHKVKAKKREHIDGPGVHENADSWWKT